MSEQTPDGEEIRPGASASVENLGDGDLAIAVLVAGCCVDMALAPGQAIEVTAGDAPARVMLRGGNPDDLLVVQPDTP